MSVIKCQSCGFENAAGGNFCEKCGNSIKKQGVISAAINSAMAEKNNPLSNKYENLRSISKFYKVIMIIIGLIALFAAWKVYEYTGNFLYAFVTIVLFVPISILVGSQSDKIDISISQEKSMRECAYYLKKIVEQITRNQ